MGVEIRLQGTAIACIAQEDIRSGLAVKLGPATNAPRILGGLADPDPRVTGSIYSVLQGASKPSSDNDASAKFVAAFRVYNEKPPLFDGVPVNNIAGNAVPYVLRNFVQGTANLPASVTLRMTTPRLAEDETIPSGALMLAYDDGIYTVTSGCFTAGSYTIGSKLSVKTGGTWYQDDTAPVGIVFEQNSTKNTLTIKTGG